MANLLSGRKASSNPSYEGFDLSHNVYFTSSVGHILPIHWDFLLPGDKIDIKTHMTSRLMPMNSASPVTLREHVDYYFVPLECLYSLFPSMLSDTNEDASSSLFNSQNFSDGFPVSNIQEIKNLLSRSAMAASGSDMFDFDYMFRDGSRLIEFFKYGSLPVKSSSESDYPDTTYKVCNLLLVQAYNAVWQYYFRDDKRIQFDPSKFNVDKYYDTLIIPSTEAFPMFSLGYRMWKKDPYTIVSPSPLGGSSSFNHFSDNVNDSGFSSFVKQWLSLSDNFGLSEPTSSTSNQNGDNPSTSSYPSYTDTVFPNRTNANPLQQSLQQHRIAQAIEKLSSIWLQSGKNYKDMMSNLFGVNAQEDWSKPIYIGSDSNVITINEEVSPVETGYGTGDSKEVYTEAGKITGRGYGVSQGESKKFTAKTHGIVLALYSAVPDAIYAWNAFDMFNTYSKRNSFPFPQTDELGEQPLFTWEVNEFPAQSIDTNGTYGWLPRFHELKLKENRAYGAFRNSLAYWIPFRDFQAYQQDIPQSFYVRPDYLDNIMQLNYDKSLHYSKDNWDPFDIDPMMHFFRVEEHKSSKMSSFGVPKTYFG